MHVGMASYLVFADLRVPHLLGDDTISCVKASILCSYFRTCQPLSTAMPSRALFLSCLVVEFWSLPLATACKPLLEQYLQTVTLPVRRSPCPSDLEGSSLALVGSIKQTYMCNTPVEPREIHRRNPIVNQDFKQRTSLAGFESRSKVLLRER